MSSSLLFLRFILLTSAYILALKTIQLGLMERKKTLKHSNVNNQDTESKLLKKKHYITYVISGNKFYLIVGIVENELLSTTVNSFLIPSYVIYQMYA